MSMGFPFPRDHKRLRVEHTRGDFPQTRKTTTRLACCTTTTCMVFLGGAGGLLLGFIAGLYAATSSVNWKYYGFLIGLIQWLGMVLLWSALGLAVGAGIGFLLDAIF